MAHPSPRDVCPRASGCLFPAPPRPASAAGLGLLQYAPAAATPAAAPALYPPDAYVAVPSTSRDPPSWRRCCDACGPRVHGRGRYCVSGRIRGVRNRRSRSHSRRQRRLAALHRPQQRLAAGVGGRWSGFPSVAHAVVGCTSSVTVTVAAALPCAHAAPPGKRASS